MSKTYIANVIQLVAWILAALGIDIGLAELSTTVTTLVAIAAGLYVFIGRWKVGDINILGFRK